MIHIVEEYQSDVMTSRRRRETKNRGPVLVRPLLEKGHSQAAGCGGEGRSEGPFSRDCRQRKQ